MKIPVTIFPLVVLVGCAAPASNPPAWAPSSAEVRTVFGNINSPYQDSFESHAYADGFISAYAAGPGALGALISTPDKYTEKTLGDAYRLGFSEGGKLAFLNRNPK